VPRSDMNGVSREVRVEKITEGAVDSNSIEIGTNGLKRGHFGATALRIERLPGACAASIQPRIERDVYVGQKGNRIGRCDATGFLGDQTHQGGQYRPTVVSERRERLTVILRSQWSVSGIAEMPYITLP
jgi:hypothetical protein